MTSGFRRSRAVRALSRLVLFAALLAGGSLPFAGAVAATAACATSGPSASYAVTVCIASPADGSTLSGLRSTTATVSVTGSSPGIQKLVFYLRGAYLLTDLASPYAFTLDTAKFVDGPGILEIEAVMRDGFVSARGGVSLTLSNGVTSPPVNTNTFSPSPSNWSGTGPLTVAVAGDGASGEPNAQAATDLIASWNPNLMLYLGDVYEKGTSTEFDNWYGGPTAYYGRFRSITNPAIGNHEYEGTLAPGYFNYWDNVPHNYSYTVGGWHFISLDSTSQYNQTSTGTGQVAWLANDLAANTAPCTIAYFHHPRYSIGPNGDTSRMATIWSMLANAGVDLILNGHDHEYQRWLPLDGNGATSPAGITQFVVGTGGHGIQPFARTDARLAVGFDTSPGAIGALRLQLTDGFAGYAFVNTAGSVLDSGSVACQSGVTDTEPPSTPPGLTATAIASNRVELAWGAATDNIGVSAYDVYRNGALRTSVGGATLAWSDTTVAPSTPYTYTLIARDLAGNASAPSSPASTTTPASGGAVLFSDGFESGTLAAWTNLGMTVQGTEVSTGTKAARGVSVSSAAWAWHAVSPTMTEPYYRVRFKIVSLGANNVYILKERTATGGSIGGFYVSNTDGTLNLRNDAGAVTVRGSTVVSLGAWHELQVRLKIAGTSGEVETWLDGGRVAELSRIDNFGTTPVGRIQIGDNTGGRTFDLVIDDVALDSAFIGGQAPVDTTPPTIPIGVAAVANGPGRVDVSWSPSSDATGVAFYDIYRDDDIVDSVLGNSQTYGDTTVSAGTTYSYRVRARDAAGNASAQSLPAIVTTPGLADSEAPSVPADVVGTPASVTRIDLSWTASIDNVGVTGYTVYRDATAVVTLAPGATSWSNTGLQPDTSYGYEVDAVDAAGNRSARSAVVTARTLADTSAPTAPSALTVTGVTISSVSLGWGTASDDVGVAAYDIYRNGGSTASATVGPATLAWIDTSVTPGSTYSYTVSARDAVGNTSPPSGSVSATVPSSSPPLFATGFESGTLTGWTNVGVVIDGVTVHGGSYAARGVSTGGATWAWAYLNSPASDVYVRAWVRLAASPSKTTTILKLRTATGGSLLGILVTSRGRLSYRNDVAGRTVNSTTTMSAGAWHELVVHLTTTGTSSVIAVWLDGSPVAGLTGTDNFGTGPIGRVQIGENQTSRPIDASFDDLTVQSQPF